MSEEIKKELDPILAHSNELLHNIRRQEAEICESMVKLNASKNEYADYCKKHKLKISDGISHEAIIESICNLLNYDAEEIKEKNRKREIVSIRQCITFALHFIFNKKTSLKTIGQWIGGQDHSSVLHSVGVVQSVINNKEVNSVTYENYSKMAEFLKTDFYIVLPEPK